MKNIKVIFLARIRWVLECLGFNFSEVKVPQPQRSNAKQSYPKPRQSKVDTKPKVRRKRLGMQKY